VVAGERGPEVPLLGYHVSNASAHQRAAAPWAGASGAAGADRGLPARARNEAGCWKLDARGWARQARAQDAAWFATPIENRGRREMREWQIRRAQKRLTEIEKILSAGRCLPG